MAALGSTSNHPAWVVHRARPAVAQRVRPRHRHVHRVREQVKHRGPSFARVDGLDGLRGLAVLAVLIFHLWPTLLPGGFIGVTLFFSLSGYLITSIIVHEIETTGSLSLRRFYNRRFRRLMPVSLATITAVVVGWSLAGWFTPDVRRDVLFSLGQSANWGHVLLQQRYGVDASASPVLHYWSLGIEEQLYLVLPLALVLCQTRRRAQVAVGVGLAASVVAVIQASGSAALSYYSTFTRGGEVLAGALAALILGGRKWQGRYSSLASGAVAVAGLGALGLVAVRTDVSTPWFARGGLLICAGLSVLVIAAVSSSPRLGRIVDWWALARLGQISYAVYLFHWPLLQTFRRISLDPAIVPWMTAATTVALALTSEHWFERPIRSGAVDGRRLVVAAACTAMLIPIVGLIGVSTGGRGTDFEAAAAELDAMIAASVTAPAIDSPAVSRPSSIPQPTVVAETTPTPAVTSPAAIDTGTVARPGAPIRIGFFGDSKALTLALGTAQRGFPELQMGTSFVGLGCPTGRGGKVREDPGAAVYDTAADCDWTLRIPANAMTTGGLDVAVVWSGTWDIRDRLVSALGKGWTNISDAGYRNWLLAEMVQMNDAITTSTGAAKVLWLTVPIDPASPHPERFGEWTSLLFELQAQRPDAVEIIDVAAYVDAYGDARRLLPDGVHPSRGAEDPAVNSAAELTERLIVPALATA